MSPINSESLVHEVPIQTDRTTCWTCKKNVGLIELECRCGYIFCKIHLHSVKHNCPFDYIGLEKERIKKENPPIIADKIRSRL